MYRFQGFVLLAAFAVAGCGQSAPLVPVTGTVKLDGKPVDGALVTFRPASGGLNAVGTGTTNAQGEFTLRHVERGAGIPAGEYKVTLSTERSDREGAEIFPAKYHNPEETILTASVPEGGKSFDFTAQSSRK